MKKIKTQTLGEMIDEVEQMVVAASRQSDNLARRMTDNLTNVWTNLVLGEVASDTPVSDEYGEYDGNESVAA